MLDVPEVVVLASNAMKIGGRLHKLRNVYFDYDRNSPLEPWLVTDDDDTFNLVMMPVAYIGFFILQNKGSYLGTDANRGVKGTLWNIILIAAILVVAAGAIIKILSLLG